MSNESTKIKVRFESEIDEQHDGVIYSVYADDHLFATVEKFGLEPIKITLHEEVLSRSASAMNLLSTAWLKFDKQGTWSDFEFEYEACFWK